MKKIVLAAVLLCGGSASAFADTACHTDVNNWVEALRICAAQYAAQHPRWEARQHTHRYYHQIQYPNGYRG
jgi:hypothetical protein